MVELFTVIVCGFVAWGAWQDRPVVTLEDELDSLLADFAVVIA